MHNSLRLSLSCVLLTLLGCGEVPPVPGPDGTLGYCCPVTATEGCGAQGVPGGWTASLDECAARDFDHERATLSTDAYGCEVLVSSGLCEDNPPCEVSGLCPMEPTTCNGATECPGLTEEEAQNMGMTTFAACVGPRPAGENISRECASGVFRPSCGPFELECSENELCTEDACGFGVCIADCSADDSCAAQGLTCEDGICAFSCLTDGFAGCAEGNECRSNGQCGVPLCTSDADCAPNEVCNEPTHLLLTGHDGCDPRPCTDAEECGEGLHCVEGNCSTEIGMCGEAMVWFPPA